MRAPRRPGRLVPVLELGARPCGVERMPVTSDSNPTRSAADKEVVHHDQLARDSFAVGRRPRNRSIAAAANFGPSL
jgi:hypothetical protein